MEKNNEDQKMEIDENIPQNKQNHLQLQISTGKDGANAIKPGSNQNLQIQTNASSETTVTNYSSTETFNFPKDTNDNVVENEVEKVIHKFEPIFKIDASKKNFDYYYNTEYFDEIYTNLLFEEKNAKNKIEKDYMDKQNDITHKMRAILVDWIIEVHFRFHLKRKTLFQTIYIIDLFLSKKIINRYRLQLLGIASLLIACKENEIIYPQTIEFVNITNNAYTKKELLNMEIYVLQTLNYDVFLSTSEEFYGILSKAFNFNKVQHCLGEYFLDSSLIDYRLLKYKPSIIAAACAYIVMKFSAMEGYKELYSQRIVMDDYPQKIIKECAKDLCFFVKDLSNSFLRAAKDKYSLPQFYNVAALCEQK